MRAENRSDAIAGRLRDKILKGDYQPGERLPAERDLASRLGVNRSSVREALKKLEQLGLVTIRRGDGTTVRHLHEASLEIARHLLTLDGQINRPLLEQFTDAYEMLMAGVFHLAVERGSDEDLNRARELVAHIEEADTPRSSVNLVSELVELVTEASGNFVLRLFRNTFKPIMSDGVAAVGPYFEEFRPRQARVLRELDAALANRDPDAAAAATRALCRMRNRLAVEAMEAGETGIAS